jgi:hypothetical protein
LFVAQRSAQFTLSVTFAATFSHKFPRLDTILRQGDVSTEITGLTVGFLRVFWASECSFQGYYLLKDLN